MELSSENAISWLNNELFEKVIENHLKVDKNEFKILNIDIKPATKTGENYLSVMFRTKILIERDDKEFTLSYVVKALLSDAIFEEWAHKFCAFPKEIRLYTQIIPKLENVWKEAGVEVNFAPKCYYSTNDPTSIIVFEDLNDYRMPDREKLLSLRESELIMEWQAKFHAASLAVYGSKGPDGEDIKEGLYKRSMQETYEKYYENFFDHYIGAIKKIPNGSYYAEKVEKWRRRTFGGVINALKYDPDGFPQVLNHGDMWICNLMYHYDKDGNPDVVKMVDYQLSVWATPALDIFNIMISSWQEDIKIKKFDYLIKYYYNTLVKSLETLKYKGKIPSLEKLHEELKKRCFIGSAFTIEGLSISMFASDEVNGDEYYYKLLNNERFLKALEQVFPFLDEKGGLEVP